MNKISYSFKLLPVDLIQRDAEQPRRDFGTEGDENKLRLSIEKYGIESPISVSEIEKDRYIIIDGHRRYICAQKLGLEEVPCRIYPKMPVGEFESRRWQVQNNRRPWKPMERSESLERIKTALNFKNNRELAEHVYMSETSVANSLQMRKEKVSYLDLMQEYSLNEAYRVELMRLKPKIRKIRQYEVDEIIRILLDKVQHKVIRNSRDFRILGNIFLRATANEVELDRFLSDPDMTVNEMEQRTMQSGFSHIVEELITKIGIKRQDGIAFSSQEKDYLEKLKDLLSKIV